MATSRGEASRARALVFHGLAEAVAPPAPGLPEFLLATVTIAAQVLDSPACQRAARDLADLRRTDPVDLRDRYGRLVAGPDRRPVALYESLHRLGQLAGPTTWALERHYRALGLAPTGGELPDHASMELAFLGYLAGAEADARAAGDGRLVSRLVAAQRAFLHAHAGAWLPELGAALVDTADPLYALVGRLLGGFLSEESVQRLRARPGDNRLPNAMDPAACSLCGLCVGSCPSKALWIAESATSTALTLDPQRCNGCRRCMRICPEDALSMTTSSSELANGAPYQVIRRSDRASCPGCGRPTVSQAELSAVFARLRPDANTQARLSLCVWCKSGRV